MNSKVNWAPWVADNTDVCGRTSKLMQSYRDIMTSRMEMEPKDPKAKRSKGQLHIGEYRASALRALALCVWVPGLGRQPRSSWEAESENRRVHPSRELSQVMMSTCVAILAAPWRWWLNKTRKKGCIHLISIQFSYFEIFRNHQFAPRLTSLQFSPVHKRRRKSLNPNIGTEIPSLLPRYSRFGYSLMDVGTGSIIFSSGVLDWDMGFERVLMTSDEFIHVGSGSIQVFVLGLRFPFSSGLHLTEGRCLTSLGRDLPVTTWCSTMQLKYVEVTGEATLWVRWSPLSWHSSDPSGRDWPIDGFGWLWSRGQSERFRMPSVPWLSLLHALHSQTFLVKGFLVAMALWGTINKSTETFALYSACTFISHYVYTTFAVLQSSTIHTIRKNTGRVGTIVWGLRRIMKLWWRPWWCRLVRCQTMSDVMFRGQCFSLASFAVLWRGDWPAPEWHGWHGWHQCTALHRWHCLFSAFKKF